MLSHKSFVACATLALVCSLAATNPAMAGEAGPSSVAACDAAGGTSIRTVGHPARSQAFPRRADTPGQCAAGARKALMLAGFLDAPGGKALVDGNVEKASRQIDGRTGAVNVQTNRCVLHTLQRNWSDARSACDAAVESATRTRARIKFSERGKIRQADRIVTAAYSNRAVMSWLSGDSGAAYVDLANARAINPKAEFVTRNFEVAVRVPAQVQLPADPYQIG